MSTQRSWNISTINGSPYQWRITFNGTTHTLTHGLGDKHWMLDGNPLAHHRTGYTDVLGIAMRRIVQLHT